MSIFNMFTHQRHYTEQDVHDQKNISTSRLAEIQKKAEEISRSSKEISDIAYNIAVATGRIKSKKWKKQ